MRINTNVASIDTQRILSRSSADATRSIGRLSSGLRIARAADDAAGLGIANKFRADIASMKVAQRNTTEASSLLQVAEGSVNSISSILVRMKELATQAASVNSNAVAGGPMDKEFQALQSEIDRIAQGTNYQGAALIDGTLTAKAFQVGTTNTANDKISVTLGNLQTAAAGLNIAAATTKVDTQANAALALASIDTAIGSVNQTLGDIGAYMNRLDYANANLGTAIENYSASESVIRDADMATEMSNFTKNQILQQAGTAMLAQANNAPQLVLKLLG